MNSTILLSEQFERAAYSLQHAFGRFSQDIIEFTAAVERFERTVHLLEELQNENQIVSPHVPTL